MTQTEYLDSQFIYVKSRKQGCSNINFMINLDPLYNIRTSCKHLYQELLKYNMVNYKQSFTSEEDININNMMVSKDQCTLQLCKQILLTRLNE